MALSISIFQPQKVSVKFHHKKHSFLSCPSSISVPKPSTSLPIFPICQSTRSQTGPVKKGSSSSSSASANQKKRKKRSKTGGSDNLRDVEIVKGEVDNDNDEDSYTYSNSSSNSRSLSYLPNTPLPKPPAGFVVDESGRVLMASDKRIVTIVDSSNNHPLECIIRRVFRSSQGDECMLLCPVDTPVQILKSKNIDGWSAVSDEEVEAILPAAAYALAKIHMHLVHSGFCYTARGGFCYSEDDIFDFRTDDGQDVDGLPTEGVEIACFHLDGSHYMIYTPSDPLLFVAVKDQDGQLQIADDDLLEDPAIISAIDEETEFNALVEEEAALLESLMGVIIKSYKDMRVFAFIVSFLLFTSLWLPTLAEECGTQAGGAICPEYKCCSKSGWCGNSIYHCCKGCQSNCGHPRCFADHPIAGIPRGGGGDMGEISSEKAFDKILSQKPFAYGF